MKIRLLSSSIAIPIVIILTYLGGLWFTSLIVFGSVIAAYESSKLLILRGVKTHPLFSAILSGSLVLAGFLITKLDSSFVIFLNIVSVLSMFSAFALVFIKPNQPTYLINILGSISSGLYVGGLLSFAPLLREGTNGLMWTLYLFLSVTLTDSGAYAVGKTIGKTPFFPKISPSKTIEGSVGGLIFGTVGSVLSVIFLGIDQITIFTSFIIGLILSISAQLGDLYESLLKRQARVKDSGNLLPGHGGALDRLDSIVFTLWLLYHFRQWITT